MSKHVEDTEQFGRILRIKPVIEANPSLVACIESCFEHFYEGKSQQNHVQVVYGGSRAIYTGVGLVVDPKDAQEYYLALKLGENRMFYGIDISDPSAPSCDFLSNELGVLDGMTPPEGPLVLGAVIHRGLRMAGLLIEDFSKGSTLQVDPACIGECDDDYLNVHLPEGSIRTVRSDGKREWGDTESGEKYFNDRARIEIG